MMLYRHIIKRIHVDGGDSIFAATDSLREAEEYWSDIGKLLETDGKAIHVSGVREYIWIQRGREDKRMTLEA